MARLSDRALYRQEMARQLHIMRGMQKKVLFPVSCLHTLYSEPYGNDIPPLGCHFSNFVILRTFLRNVENMKMGTYADVSKSFRTESIRKYTLTFGTAR